VKGFLIRAMGWRLLIKYFYGSIINGLYFSIVILLTLSMLVSGTEMPDWLEGWNFLGLVPQTDTIWFAGTQSDDPEDLGESYIRLSVENGGTAGRDFQAVVARKDFVIEFDEELELELDYRVPTQTQNFVRDAVDVAVNVFDINGVSIGNVKYRLACIEQVLPGSSIDLCNDAGVIYISDGIQWSPGQALVPGDDWRKFKRDIVSDIVIDWSNAKFVNVELRIGGAWMFLDAIEAHFKEVEVD